MRPRCAKIFGNEARRDRWGGGWHGNRLDTLTERVDSFQEAVTQRLDRLIEVTLRARTADTGL